MSLCPEHEQRAAMTDNEFWEHVYPPEPEPELDDDQPEEQAERCPECGSTGACAYDADGRPLIHIRSDED